MRSIVFIEVCGVYVKRLLISGPNELSFRDDKATITILKEVEKGPCAFLSATFLLTGTNTFHT